MSYAGYCYEFQITLCDKMYNGKQKSITMLEIPGHSISDLWRLIPAESFEKIFTKYV